MRIMVVDDEKEICDYISRMPEWETIGCRVVGSATSGSKALELMDAVYPELIITDIRMPEMDGIELAEKVRESHSEIPIIFLTAYNEFEYAKKGIKLGVADFLTKPFNGTDLVQSVEVLLSQKSSSQLWMEWEESFDMLTSSALTPQEKRDWLVRQGMQEKVCQLLYVEIDHLVSASPERTPFSMQYLKREVAAAIEKSGLQAWSASAVTGIYVLLFTPRGAAQDTLNSHAMALAREIVELHVQETFSLSATLSRVMDSALELDTAIEQVHKSMEYRMLLGRRSVIAFDAVEQMLDERKKETDFSMLQLGDVIRRADMDGIRTLLRDIYRQLLSAASGKKEMQHVCLSLLDKSEQVLTEMGIALPSAAKVEVREKLLACVILTDLMLLTERKLLSYASLIAEANSRLSSTLVMEVKRLIENNYMDDINLQTTARQLNISYSYLSRLIKKETGKNFSELLWSQRIEVAKALLIRGDLKVYEVAYAVGFKDPAHFNILFKKWTGLTPNAYRPHSEVPSNR